MEDFCLFFVYLQGGREAFASDFQCNKRRKTKTWGSKNIGVVYLELASQVEERLNSHTIESSIVFIKLCRRSIASLALILSLQPPADVRVVVGFASSL